MKKTVLVIGMMTVMGQSLLAQGLLSRFELVNGKLDECPTELVVTRSQKDIVVRVIRSSEMTDGAVFQNAMYFNQINQGWQVTESSSAGVFSNNTELVLGSSAATLLREEKLTKADKVLRHTQKVLTVSDEDTAVLEYKIVTLDKNTTAQGYVSFKCEYVTR